VRGLHGPERRIGRDVTCEFCDDETAHTLAQKNSITSFAGRRRVDFGG
jgi:hypothetical protein